MKKLWALHALEVLEQLFKIFRTFVCKKVPGKIRDKYMENLKQASGEIQAPARPPNFLVPLLCTFNLQFTFFSEQPFYGNFSTLDSHTNTVISHTFAYSSRWRRKP